MLLDTRTLYMVLFLGNLTLFLLLVTFVRSSDFEGPVRRFMIGKLLQGVGIGLASLLRGLIPDNLSVIVGNGLFFIGVALESHCLTYVGQHPSRRANAMWAVITAGFVLGFGMLAIGEVNIAVRAFVNSMIIVAFSLMVAISLLFYNNRTALRRSLGVFFAIMVIPQLARGVDAVAHQSNYILLMISPVQTVSLLLSIMHMLISSVSYLLLSREIVDLRLQQAAVTDYLTGASNRLGFIRQSSKLLVKLMEENALASVLMIDLDHFKKINDTYGHATGDDVLVDFCRQVRTVLRPADIFGRYGGEEFVVLAPYTDAEQASTLGRKIQTAVEKADLRDVPAYTISIGTVTVAEKATADLETLIKQADAALLCAKKTGRNKVVQFRSERCRADKINCGS